MTHAVKAVRGAVAVPRLGDGPNPCALCPGAEHITLFEVDGAEIARCLGCGLVRQTTRPISLAPAYGADYYASDRAKGGYANYFLDSAINRLTFRERLRAIEARAGERGRLLDVGCALGDLVLEATATGWDAEGVEISAYAAARARGRGVVVHTGTLEQLRLPAGAYHVVTLYDAIEHLADPVRTLREVHRLLVPGGIVHVVTPNVAGLQARAFGRRWYHYKPGEHLYYFSPATLRRAIEAGGLTWDGWRRNAAYLTLAYVLSRLRYYAPRLFEPLAYASRGTRLGEHPFLLHVGEMEAWAHRP